MATGDVALGNAGVETAHPAPGAKEDKSGTSQKPVINDFSIQVATVNGSGSQSANSVLLKSIFGMGIPVSGKNLFPSNIAGLPTWYTIRASKDGYVARKKEIDILVAMNAETAKDDILSLPVGCGCDLRRDAEPEAISRRRRLLPGSFRQDHRRGLSGSQAAQAGQEHGLRRRGGTADLARHEGSGERAAPAVCEEAEGRRPELGAVEAGYDYASESLTKQDPFVLERMHATDGKIIIDGNAAAALGAVFAGVTVVTWYPITPSSSVVEQLIDLLKKYRVEPEGKATFAVVQAEDELAAVGMVLGAGWAGARSMTSTSGPGISLMAEFAGLGYFAEIPGVIFDIQRVGPSTGMPTRTAQADLLSIAYLSHGDTKHVMLLPGTVKECFEFAQAAFDLASGCRRRSSLLSDLDLGMNNWMSEPFEYPEKPLDRGKVLTAEDLTRLGGFARYKDVDGDAIRYRTLPGTDHPQAAYFTRGSGHNEKALYTERPDEYQNLMERLDRKFETARTLVPAPVVVQTGKSKIGFIAFGTSDFAVSESRDQIKKEYGVETDYLRIRAFPFTHEIHDFVASHDRVYVVEQNRDAQMLSLLKLDLPAEEVVKLRSIRHFNGLPIDARSVTDELVLQEEI